MKLTIKKKYYLLLGGVVIFYGLFGYFVFGPWSFKVASYQFSGIFNQIKEKSSSFTDLNNAYYLMTKKRDLLYDLESEYSSVKDNLPLINDAILSKDKALDFLVMIEGLADKTGVYKEISIENVVMDDSLKTNVFPLSLKVYGPFPKISNFISLLQNSSWITKMGRLELSRSEQTTVSVGKDVVAKINAGDIQANISLKVLSK